MEYLGISLTELPWFFAHMGTAIALTVVYIVIYMWVTPHAEITLIRENNMAASLAIGGGLLGVCLPLASAIANSGALGDVVVWGIVALFVQIVLFYIVRLPIPKISERIEKGEMASGLWLGGASLAGGVLNAASMTN